MSRTSIFLVLVAVGLVSLLAHLSGGIDIQILNPQGPIALEQKRLIITAVLLMLIVVVPVYVLAALIAWKYRATNTDAPYTPDHDHDQRIEIVWWTIPLLIILTLGTITWKTTHALDPFRPLDSTVSPVTIQVVALNWKWLFIYPEYGIATVNYVAFPEDTPVSFHITADAPMNSFWIPSLGSQIYAMAGMSTRLHLLADQPGTYHGLSANWSGEGFSGMKFIAQSLSREDFDSWVAAVRQISSVFDTGEYDLLALPSSHTPVRYFGHAQPGLYDYVVNKYMQPHDTMPVRVLHDE